MLYKTQDHVGCLMLVGYDYVEIKRVKDYFKTQFRDEARKLYLVRAPFSHEQVGAYYRNLENEFHC